MYAQLGNVSVCVSEMRRKGVRFWQQQQQCPGTCDPAPLCRTGVAPEIEPQGATAQCQFLSQAGRPAASAGHRPKQAVRARIERSHVLFGIGRLLFVVPCVLVS